MRGATLITLLCAILATGPARADPRAWESLRQCIESRFMAESETRLDDAFATEAECPGLTETLTRLPGYEQLDQPVGKETSLHQLLDVRELLAPSPATYTPSLAYDHASLEHMAQELKIEIVDQQLSWWERFKLWLKEKLENDKEGDWRWLSDWLDGLKMPEWGVTAIYYLSVSIIVLLALLVIGNELRELRGRRRRTLAQEPAVAPARPGMAAEEMPDWREITALPASAQIPAMLCWLIARMMRETWLPRREDLTNRELLNMLARMHAGEAREFSTIVASAERLTYGDLPLRDEQIESSREAARRLREALRGGNADAAASLRHE